MIIDWDIKKIKRQINKIVIAATDPKMDGFNTWGCKKDLYKILWHVEDSLDKCSSYVDEDEFVKRREQQQLIKALGKK